MSTPTRPFTDATWADFTGVGLTRHAAQERRLTWAHQADLAAELAERSALPEQQTRLLVEATCSGLPVTLTWHEQGRTTTAAVIVDQLVPPFPLPDLAGGWVRVRYWGFAHPVNLRSIRAVEAPATVYAFDEPSSGEPNDAQVAPYHRDADAAHTAEPDGTGDDCVLCGLAVHRCDRAQGAWRHGFHPVGPCDHD